MEREQILERIRVMEKKRPWLTYSAARDEFVQVKQLRRTAQQELEQLKQSQSPLQQELDAVREQIAETRENREELMELGRKAQNDLKKVSAAAEKAGKDADEAYREIQEIQERTRTRQRRVAMLRDELDKVEAELGERPQLNTEEMQQRINAIGKETRELNAEKIRLENETAESRDEFATLQDRYNMIDRQLRAMQDVKEQRVENLKRGAQDTYRALMWLRENQHRFQRPIFEPILLQVHLFIIYAHIKYLTTPYRSISVMRRSPTPSNR